MFKLEDVIQLKPQEEIRLVTKRHAVTIIPKLALALLLIVVPFFFLFSLFRTGPTGVILFIALVSVGLIIAWRTFAMWDGDAFIVSTVRIVKVTQTGIFSRIVSEAAIDQLSDVTWKKHGIGGVVFKYGDLTISTAGQQKIEAPKLADPQYIHALIAELRDLSRAKRPAPPDEETRAKRVQKLIEGLNEDDLELLERKMKNQEREAVLGSLYGVERPAASGANGDIAVKRVDAADGGLKPLTDA